MRIDKYIVDNYNLSRTKAQQMLKESMIAVNGKIVTKPAFDVSEFDKIDILNTFSFASLGGDKLEKAINDFHYNLSDKICVDIGASNGGFTDCMLQHGAKKVFAVDVGECAFNDNLKNDPRVIVKDRTNARYLTYNDLGEKCDFSSVDVSFISLKLILPTVYNVLKNGGDAICLIKPQFEVGSKYLSKKGLVLDNKVRNNVTEDIKEFAVSLGFEFKGITTAPIKEHKNVEFLIYIHKSIE